MVELDLVEQNEPSDDSQSPPLKSLGASSDPLLGVVLGERYKIIEFVGSGGWGNVYKGQHLTLGMDIAIKIIHKHLTRNEDSLKRFQQEALSLSRLESPHIVRLMDYGLEPVPYIIMEFFEGIPLDKWLKANKSLKGSLAIDLFMQICHGLSKAHGQGLVHRDMKPANILLKVDDKQVNSKLLDFGIAKLIDEKSTITTTGEVLGSPPYMAPEQWNGLADHRSDLYSLGCIMYEVISAKPAFSAEHGFAYINKHFTSTPAKIRSFAPDADFPDALEDLIDKCLEKSPERRYQSAEEIIAELARVKMGRKLQIYINSELRRKEQRKIGLIAIALASLVSFVYWEKESILSPWCNYFNKVADGEQKQGNYSAAVEDFKRSLIVRNLLPSQNKGLLHAMRMLAFCLTKQKDFAQAAQIQKQVDDAIGFGPWSEFNNLLKRVKYRLFAGSNANATLELGRQSLKMAAGLAGTHSLAYSAALDQEAQILETRGLHKQALQSERESLRITRDLLETNSVLLAESLNHEAEILLSLGEADEAEKSLLQALDISAHVISGTESVHEYISELRPIVLADLNDGITVTNTGGAIGTWEKDESDKTQGTQISFAVDDAAGLPEGKCLQIDYDVDSPNRAYNGVWLKLYSEDFSNFANFDTLNLYLKGDASKGFTRRLKVELKDFTSKASPYYIDGITDKWKKFSIPFNKFKMVSDWGRMNEFVLSFEDDVSNPKTGRVFLDQVFISNENQDIGTLGALAQTVAAYNSLAEVQMEKVDRESALAFLDKAYKLCQSHSELESLPTLTNLARIYADKGLPEKSLEYWKKALECQREEGSYLGIHSTPNNEFVLAGLADAYYQLKDYKQAETYLEEAFRIRQPIGDQKNQNRLSRVMGRLIRVKEALGKTGEAASLKLRLQKLSGE